MATHRKSVAFIATLFSIGTASSDSSANTRDPRRCRPRMYARTTSRCDMEHATCCPCHSSHLATWVRQERIESMPNETLLKGPQIARGGDPRSPPPPVLPAAEQGGISLHQRPEPQKYSEVSQGTHKAHPASGIHQSRSGCSMRPLRYPVPNQYSSMFESTVAKIPHN